MKSLITLVALLSLHAFAQDPQPAAAGTTGDNFADRKAQALAHMDKKIAMMNDMKSCISGTTDAAGLKACHEKMREQHKGMKMERMDRKMQRLQDKKAKMAK